MRYLIFLAFVTAAVAQSRVKQNRVGYELPDNKPIDTCQTCLVNSICNRTEPKVEIEAPGVDANHLTVGKKHYHLNFYFKANYFVATEYCRSLGMHLATVESKEESVALLQYMTLLGYATESVWISGSKLGQEGKFIWMSTGTQLIYQNFMPGQPDNYGNNELCLEIRTLGGWNDLACLNLSYFICQY